MPDEYPCRGDFSAPLFPGMSLTRPTPSGVRCADDATTCKTLRLRQATALAELSVAEAEARLLLDWLEPLRHGSLYKAVYRPAVLRANRLTPSAGLSAQLKFHSLRHTHASLCVAAGIPPFEISRFMGHAKVTTTLTAYAHLINTDDHAEAMAALEALDRPLAENVVSLRKHS
jgi:integrase